MADTQPYVVTVLVQSCDATQSLLSLAAALHRRAARISRAELARTDRDGQVFQAIFTASDRHAATICASLENLVEVLEVTLSRPARPLNDPEPWEAK